MRYGLPYKGSKNGIAQKIVALFPPAANFYDLFAGGGAITHCTLLSEKFENHYMNDINADIINLFFAAVKGKFRNEKRWISRDDFSRLKDSDKYVNICWSFGNKGKNYLYGRHVEPWKKALHFARVLGDKSLLQEFGIDSDGSRKDIKEHHAEYKKKYIAWYKENILQLNTAFEKKELLTRVRVEKLKLQFYLKYALLKSKKTAAEVDRFLGTNGMAGHYFGRSQWEFPAADVYAKLQTFLPLFLPYNIVTNLSDYLQSLQSLQRLQSLESLESLESLQSLQRLQSLERLESLERLQSLERLESLERLQSLERLESLQRLQSLETSSADYRNIEIKPNSVIYCDIPYKGTDGYSVEFDHAAFYEWCKQQTELCFISSYEMPDDFICIASFEKPALFSGGSSHKVIEKVFIPKHQLELYQQRCGLLISC